MWPCAIGSREETATSACSIHGKGRSWFLCRVILNATGFFAGKASAVCRCSYNSGGGLPRTGDRKTSLPAPFAVASNCRIGNGPPGLGTSGRRPGPPLRAASGTAEASPAFPLPPGQGTFCSPWAAFEQAFSMQRSNAVMLLQSQQPAPGRGRSHHSASWRRALSAVPDGKHHTFLAMIPHRR